MIIARFQFKPGRTDQFAWQPGQSIVEMSFDNVSDLIELCQGIEDAIEDCHVIMNGKLISLKGVLA